MKANHELNPELEIEVVFKTQPAPQSCGYAEQVAKDQQEMAD